MGFQHEEAIELGVFGSPFYLCDGHLFWGQDRLPFLEDVLRSRGGEWEVSAHPLEAGGI